jgi:hypothetical protein
MGRSGPRVSREERFWEKVVRGDGCWEWLAKKNNKGYGMFGGRKVDGFVLAHRVAYELTHGAIPKGRFVLHRCDNRGCVNPEHLFVGDYIDNVRDMHAKGRGRAKITYAVAEEIRARRTRGESRKEIMVALGVSVHTVKDVVSRSWKRDVYSPLVNREDGY